VQQHPVNSMGRGARTWGVSRLSPRLAGVALVLAAAAMTSGCDVQNIRELEEGVSTEADVRQRFGEPEAVWDGAGGERIFEYNRQPEGYQNYMIGIGPNGKMSSLRQVLNPNNFAHIQPGMAMEDVRRRLGKPKAVSQWPAKGEIHYDWRFHDGPNTSDAKIFTVVFSPDLRVMRTETVIDPDLLYQSGR
jgi:hypothetical protein